MRTFILPWKMGSKSSKLLADALGIKRVYPDRNYKPKKGDRIINWGSTTQPKWFDPTGPAISIINEPANVGTAVDKRAAFIYMAEGQVRVPQFTFDSEQALKWVIEGKPTFARHKTRGHAGNGMELLITANEVGKIPLAPLYTQYVKKSEEYRIHVAFGKVIDVAQKKLKNGVPKEDIDYKIRTHDGGWVFTRVGVEPPQDVLHQAIKAIGSLGLSFGAVDVGWNDYYQQATVYEVNSAPGLAGTTLYKYAKLFSDRFKLHCHLKIPDLMADEDVELYETEEFNKEIDEPTLDDLEVRKSAKMNYGAFADMFKNKVKVEDPEYHAEFVQTIDNY